MIRRESVMLCHNFDMTRHSDKIIGWYMSQKLDGMRCFWDGGITRNLLAQDVPWANTDKHSRYQKPIVCTGLWTRYYQSIAAPNWFLDMLPPFPLDGELYNGIDGFQQVMSICKKLEPDSEDWRKIKYCIFDIPTISDFLKPGKINIPNFTKVIEESYWDWAKKRMEMKGNLGKRPQAYYFNEIVDYLIWDFDEWENKNLMSVGQEIIDGISDIENGLDHMENIGGEGVIIRSPHSHWTPFRSWDILKVKNFKDGEGTIVGYIGGRATEKGSKLLGLMGALIIKWVNPINKEIYFELSGFNDEEREMVYVKTGLDARLFVSGFAGTRIPVSEVKNTRFPIGSRIRFRYADLSDSGIPRFARYWRS